MSYERAQSMFEFFRPRGTAPLAIEDVSAAAAVHGGMVCIKRCLVKQLQFAVEVTVVGTTTAPVLEFNRRPTIASASGEIAIGTITIPTSTAAGQVMYKNINPVVFEVGDELSFEHLTQAVGSAAGQGYYSVLCIADPEVPGNESNMVASA